MSRYFKTSPVRRMTMGIPLAKDFHCPACGRAEKNVVLTCSRCWQLLPAQDRADLRRMTMAGQDTTTKLAKCVTFLKALLRDSKT
jgi:hypothetical protein